MVRMGRLYFRTLAGSSMLMPPIIFHSFPLLIQVWVIRKVFGSRFEFNEFEQQSFARLVGNLIGYVVLVDSRRTDGRPTKKFVIP